MPHQPLPPRLEPNRRPFRQRRAAAAPAPSATRRRRLEERRRAEAQRAREAADAERLRLALHGADLALWDQNLRTNVGTVNERWSSMLGYQPHEIQPDDSAWRERLHPDDLERVLAAYQKHLDGHSDAFEATYRLRHRSGHWVWVLDRGRIVERDADGTPLRMVGTHLDVTERMESQEAVRAARRELAATLQAVPDLLFDIDIDGVIHSQHTPRDELLVMPAAQQIGRHVADVLPPDAAAVVMQAVLLAHQTGHASGLRYELDLPNAKDRAKGRRWFEVSAAPRPVSEGQVPRCILLSRDISERVQGEVERETLERQLREAQKIESLGTLAGGIAHDFNNILAAILGNAALVRDTLTPGHAGSEPLSQLQRAALRARSLVQQILTFSRRGPQELKVQALRPVVEETLQLLDATLPAAVRLETRLADTALLAEADATQLQQVLMNLCTNAWHALVQGRGRIEVGMARLGPDAALALGVAERPAGDCAHLWVADDGIGMDAATRERLFDPFFTTKPVGQGTGLGLSVVHGIVRGHRGQLAVHSTPGQGSTFHVLLPLVQHDGQPAGEVVVLEVGENSGQGRHVLVVDDDEVVAITAQALLQRAGWLVTLCSAAPQALERLRQPADLLGPFDIVVSDHNMPEMSGLEFAAIVAREHPALPLVISSGYITDELRRQAGALGVRALLQKEHTLERLPALLHQVLAAGAMQGHS